MGRDSSFSIKLNISRQKAFELVKKSLVKESPPKIVNSREMGSRHQPNEIDSPYYFFPESNRILDSRFRLKETNPSKENECLI